MRLLRQVIRSWKEIQKHSINVHRRRKVEKSGGAEKLIIHKFFISLFLGTFSTVGERHRARGNELSRAFKFGGARAPLPPCSAAYDVTRET